MLCYVEIKYNFGGTFFSELYRIRNYVNYGCWVFADVTDV